MVDISFRVGREPGTTPFVDPSPFLGIYAQIRCVTILDSDLAGYQQLRSESQLKRADPPVMIRAAQGLDIQVLLAIAGVCI